MAATALPALTLPVTALAAEPAPARRLEHLLAIADTGRIGDQPHPVEAVADRTGGAEVAAELAERMADIGHRAHAIVGQAVDDHRDAAAEHQQIADLTLARDADGAAAALQLLDAHPEVALLQLSTGDGASALSFQCQVSSNASICASECAPVGDLNRMLYVAFELNGGSR